MEKSVTKYDIGTYEIHPTTIAELESAISTNFSIAEQIFTESGDLGVFDVLRGKIVGLVRYYNDHAV